jgi:hypothetical protein
MHVGVGGKRLQYSLVLEYRTLGTRICNAHAHTLALCFACKNRACGRRTGLERYVARSKAGLVN